MPGQRNVAFLGKPLPLPPLVMYLLIANVLYLSCMSGGRMWRLANDSTVKEFQQKIRDAQKENEELASKLAKKERECEVKMEEQVE